MKRFQQLFKYKRKEMTLKNYLLNFKLKKTTRVQKKKWFNLDVAKANIVEHSQNSKTYKYKSGPTSGKGAKLGLKSEISKNRF